VAAIGLVAVLALSACQSSDVQSLPPEDDASAESTTSSSTTATTAATTSTETTLSELAEAEAAIEAAIVGWWTFPRDTSLGDDGQPLEYVTGSLFQRIRGYTAELDRGGEIMRSRGREAVRIESFDIDIEAGTAEVDVCTQGDSEIFNAETGEVRAADVPTAFTGVVFAERVGPDWKLNDFFTSQAGEDPVECDVGPAG